MIYLLIALIAWVLALICGYNVFFKPICATYDVGEGLNEFIIRLFVWGIVSIISWTLYFIL